MKLDTSLTEAELLIALLTAAEGAFAVVDPGLNDALAVLRPWRSRLIAEYIHAKYTGDLTATPPRP